MANNGGDKEITGGNAKSDTVKAKVAQKQVKLKTAIGITRICKCLEYIV